MGNQPPIETLGIAASGGFIGRMRPRTIVHNVGNVSMQLGDTWLSKRLLALPLVIGGLLAIVWQVHIWSGGARAGPIIKIMLDPPEMVAPPGAPPVEPVVNQPLAPATAEEINREVPFADLGPSAKAFYLSASSPSFGRAAYCLAQAVYYEAATEPLEGQRAVAQVVLNRVRSPAFPSSVCGVVYQGSERPTGCQFTFTCDGALARQPSAIGWKRALDIAKDALQGLVYAPVGSATHYHASYVVPYWEPSMAKISTIGLHNFYRWPGNWRAATYFSQRYSDAEPDPSHGKLAQFAIAESASAQGIGTASALQSLSFDAANLDASAKAVSAPRSNLAADSVPHTLKAEEHPVRLDPSLTQKSPLMADLRHTGLTSSAEGNRAAR